MTGGLIINPYYESRIVVQTRKGVAIENYQSHEFSQQEKNQFRAVENRFHPLKWRTEASPIYNCHGLTFASRRTGIFSSGAIREMIEDDGYTLIRDADVLPGDIILYIGDNGEFDHSGIVVHVPSEGLKIPRIVSKWGKFREAEHFANDCPYNYGNHMFYRVTK